MPTVARDVMQAEPLTIPAEMPCLEVIRTFVRARISGAPVVDGGRVVGVLSVHDLLRMIDQAFDEDIDPGEASDEASDLEASLAGQTAGELASPDVVWVREDAPIADIARDMRRLGLHRVLVGHDGHLAGVVTTFDLLAALAAPAP